MLRKYLLQLITLHRRAWREQKGQSIVIIAFAIVGIIVLMGLALDLGLVYIERVRISRTTDAATLAAVVELPYEEEAMRRAIEYIELNGYRPGIDTEIKVRGCIVVNGELKNVNETVTPPNGLSGTAAMTSREPPTRRFSEGYPYPGVPTPPLDDIVATFVIDTMAYQPAFDNDNPPDGVIDTLNNEACDGTMADPGAALFGTANKLRVAGQVKTNVNFMQVIGFGDVYVSDESVAENVANLDVVVAFDVSESMDFDTSCFGCWNKDPALADKPFPNNGEFSPLRYPADSNTLPFWGADDPTDLSQAGDPVCNDPVGYEEVAPYTYSVHEAELYSNIGSGTVDDTKPWRLGGRTPGQGFWVMQQPGPNVSSNNAFMRTHSFVTYDRGPGKPNAKLRGGTYDPSCWDPSGDLTTECWSTPDANSKPPYLDYDFTVAWAPDETHIYIRAIGGTPQRSQEWADDPRTSESPWEKRLFFQVFEADNSNNKTKILGGNLSNLNSQDYDVDGMRFLDPTDASKWQWVRIDNEPIVINTSYLPNGRYTLRVYEGSSAFDLDKIIITNDPGPGFNVAMSDFMVGGAEGPDATPGSATREACNMCNPNYGQDITDGGTQCSCMLYKGDPGIPDPGLFPGLAKGGAYNCTAVEGSTDMLSDDLFHDKDPIRSAQEAVKHFAGRLDPRFDQLGIVAFNDGIVNKVKLQCRKKDGAACYAETDPISYTNIIDAVEDFSPNGPSDLSEAMRESLEELGISAGGNTGVEHGCTDTYDDKQSCDREGTARRVLILMTDGPPTAYESDSAGCTSSDPTVKVTWRGLVGGNTPEYNCAMFFAREAAEKNVTVYTIGIGPGVDKFLLKAMAEGSVPPDPNAPTPCNPDNVTNGHPCGDAGFYFTGRGGQYFQANKPTELDGILEIILDNIYVRIVG